MSESKKHRAAAAAADLVEDGMLVGLGTGSTASLAVEILGAKVRAGALRIRGVCTSKATEEIASKFGIPFADPGAERPDIYIDGADRIAPSGIMIKGGGGALLREKMVAVNALRRIIVVDDGKLAEQLGHDFPLPVEIIRFGREFLFESIRRVSNSTPRLRMQGTSPYVTDENHHILDCEFAGGIDDPAALAVALKAVPGVVETGLFVGLCDELFIGTESGVERRTFDHHTEL